MNSKKSGLRSMAARQYRGSSYLQEFEVVFWIIPEERSVVTMADSYQGHHDSFPPSFLSWLVLPSKIFLGFLYLMPGSISLCLGISTHVPILPDITPPFPS
jgi:hypothetical protein